MSELKNMSQYPAVVAEWSKRHILYCLIMSHPQQTQVGIPLEDFYMVKILNKKELWTRYRHLWIVI